jgi:hypothetical protein
MRISVIIPTITGREASFATMTTAYRDRASGHDVEIVSVLDRPSWPAGCNAGQLLATGDVLHFGADDLEPVLGWADAMLACLARDEIPAAQVWDHVLEGPCANEAQDGPAGSLTAFSRVPAFTREMAERIGPWPEMPYYADNWVSDKARLLGYETRVTAGYAFIHHWHPVGRLDAGDWVGRYKPLYNAERALLGLAPV